MQPNKWEQKGQVSLSGKAWNLKNSNAVERRDGRNKHLFPRGW